VPSVFVSSRTPVALPAYASFAASRRL
jgi:hypothetical protein